MKKSTEIIVRGIKCDAHGCGYSDMEADVSDLGSWLNNPCPKCGASLLTQADLDSVKLMQSLSSLANEVIGPAPDDAEFYLYSIGMDGSGVPTGFTFNRKVK